MFFISYKYDLMGGIIFHLFFILAKKNACKFLFKKFAGAGF